MFQFVRNHVLPNWKSIIVVLAPLLLLPLPLSRMKVVDLTIRQQESDTILKNFQICLYFSFTIPVFIRNRKPNVDTSF